MIFIEFYYYLFLKYFKILDYKMEDLIPSNLAKKSFANTANSFYVVKGLKNTEEQYEMLCNRIKILRTNDEKNRKKI